MGKYLVTGGAGFIGSNLVDTLIEQGHEVIVWDKLTTGKKENVNKQADFYYTDVATLVDPFNDRSIEREAGGFDAIFHLAGEARIQPSFDNPTLCHRSNVTGTVKILENARRRGTQVIYAGSSSVYHDPYANPYSFTKAKAEEYCWLYNRIYDLPVAIARFFNVYGPRQVEIGKYATVLGIFERQKKSGEPLTVTGDGDQRRDFTHISDIVSGLIEISKIKWTGTVFNLGSGVNYSINEVAAMFNGEIEYIPARPGEARDTLADLTMMDILDWKPQKCLKEYVVKFLESLDGNDSQD